MSSLRNVAVVLAMLAGVGAVQAQEPVAPEPPKASGVVLDVNGRPLADVQVDAVTSYSPLMVPPDRLLPLTRTGPDGKYSFPTGHLHWRQSAVGILFRKKGFANVRVCSFADWSLPPLTMHPGVSLTGRVMDAKGAPLAGVTVVAMDMLVTWESFLDTTVFAPQTNIAFATSDQRGVFVLDGLVPHGVDVIALHPQYMVHERFAVDLGDPLEIKLLPGGHVRGRLVDRAGKPLAGVLVQLYPKTIRWRYRPYRSPSVTDAEGRFELSRNDSGPYDVSAGHSEPPIEARMSKLIGDQDALEFVVDWRPQDDKPAPPPPVDAKPVEPAAVAAVRAEVRAIDADTGQPVRDFVAAPLRTGLRGLESEHVLHWEGQFEAARLPAREGVAGFTQPWLANEDAVIAVRAPGYVTQVAAVPQTCPASVVVRLVKAHKLTGVVVDWVSGKPVANAAVAASRRPRRDFDDWRYDDWSMRHRQLSCWPAFGWVRTDDQGRFAIDHLPPDSYQVLAQLDGSPLSETGMVQLRGRDAEIRVRLMGPTRVTLEIKGVDRIDASWRLRSGRPYPRPGSEYDLDVSSAVAIGADRTAVLVGLAPGERHLELLVQHPFRLGGIRKLSVQRFVLAEPEQKITVDLGRVAPIAIRGRIRLTGMPIAMHRLLVVAEPTLDAVSTPTPYLSLIGSRDFVRANGWFELQVPPATVSLLVVDAATGVIFTKTEPFAHDREHPPAEQLLDVDLVEARLRIQGQGSDHARRLEIRIEDKWPGGIGRMAAAMTKADCRIGIPLTEGQTEVAVFLPTSPVELRILGGTGHDSPSSPVEVLGRKTVEPVSGARLETLLEWGR